MQSSRASDVFGRYENMSKIRQFGPYRLLYRISSGGMAEIYRAVGCTPSGEEYPVAIKRILQHYNDNPEFMTMLLDEARITALLHHPNIARLYELGAVGEQYFMAMEFIEGVDLRNLLLKCKAQSIKIPVFLACYIVEQALLGLHAAHEQRDEEGRLLCIVHRDFSPSNLLLSYQGEVKLIDFGIAKARFNRSQTRGGVIKGKVNYMSPEQTLGKRLDRRSDVFAAGSVLYHVITGVVPFLATHDASLMVAIREKEIEAPSHLADVDEAFDAILKKAMSKEPALRFDSAKAFAKALQDWRMARYRMDAKACLSQMLVSLFEQERHDLSLQSAELDDFGFLESESRGSATYTKYVDARAFSGSDSAVTKPFHRAPPLPCSGVDTKGTGR